MAQPADITEADAKQITDTANIIRGHSRQKIDMTSADVAAVVVEPVLSALGWNIRNLKEVRRGETGVLKLFIGKEEVLSIVCHPLNSSPDDLGGKIAGWEIHTNGVLWRVFSPSSKTSSIRSFTFETPNSARASIADFTLLQREILSHDALTDAWMADSINRDIAAALARHTAGSEEMLRLIQQDLSQGGVDLSLEIIAGAFARISSPDESVPSGVSKRPKAEKAATPKRKSSRVAPKSRTKAGSKPKSAAPDPAAKKTPVAAAKVSKSRPKRRRSKLPDFDPETAEWPEDATHRMVRKRSVAFVRQNPAGGVYVLPGTYVAAKEGKNVPPAIKEMRAQLQKDGVLIARKGMLVVQEPIALDNLRAAASLACGTLVGDARVFQDKARQTITETDVQMLNAPKAAKQDRETTA